MGTWKIIIISLIAAVTAGVGGGILIGKFLVNRAKSDKKPLLNKKERIIYLSCIVLGIALILTGVFVKFPAKNLQMTPDGLVLADESMTEENAVKRAVVKDSGVAVTATYRVG